MDALRRVMDKSSLAVFALDEDGYYLYENDAAERLLGYERAEISRKHLTDLIAVDPNWVRSGFARLKLEGHWSGRVLYRLKNGGLLTGAVNAFMHTLADGTEVDVALVHPVHQPARDYVSAAGPEIQFGLRAGQVCLLQLLAEGFSDAQLADLLHLELDKIGNQIAELLQKMGVPSRTQAAVMAIKTGAVV